MKHIHHIKPKHMGGGDEPTNLYECTVEQHAELHLDLYLTYGKYEDYIAYNMLAGRTSEGERAMNIMRAEYMRNRVITDECRKNMSRGQKARTEYNRDPKPQIRGEGNPFYGKTHDDNTRELCRQGALKQWQQKLIWVNDGLVCKRVPEDNIPEGFVRGRKLSK